MFCCVLDCLCEYTCLNARVNEFICVRLSVVCASEGVSVCVCVNLRVCSFVCVC